VVCAIRIWLSGAGSLGGAGFAEACAYPVWSRELGYLGDYHYLFLARKAA